MMRFQGITTKLIDTLSNVNAFAKARSVSAFIVGGLLRDQLLQRPLRYLNVDLAVPNQAIAFSKELARHLHGAFVLLDEQFGTARIVISDDDNDIELDISDFRGADLNEDLAHRDFTVNAIAVALEDWLKNPHKPQKLIDPLNGIQALSKRELIACFPGSFIEDPLRILRGFRFAVQLEFSHSSQLELLMKEAIPKLSDVSGERIREELLACFETDRAAWAVEAWDRLRILDVILPELIPGRGMDQGAFHHLDVLGHQIEAVNQADRIMKDFAEFSQNLQKPIADYCSQELVKHRRRKSLIKLACLLHDVGKPTNRQIHDDGDIWFLGHEIGGADITEGIVQRLRLSNNEAQMVWQLVRHHLRPGFLSREPELTRRALYRFYKELGENGPACLVTWWCDRMATRGSKSRVHEIDQQRDRLEEMFNAYFFKKEEVVKPLRLIDGTQLMEHFKLKAGPQIGALLGAIEEGQAEGSIHTVDEALRFAKMTLDELRKNH